MKLVIFLFLLALFLPLGAQLRTRYTPLPALCRVRRWQGAIIHPSWAVRLEIVRLA